MLMHYLFIHIAPFVHCKPEYIQCAWKCAFYSKENTCWYSPWHWEVECGTTWYSTWYIDEIEHAQFCDAAISIYEICLAHSRQSGRCICSPPPFPYLYWLKRFRRCLPTMSVVLTENVGSMPKDPSTFVTHSGYLFAAFLGHRWCG